MEGMVGSVERGEMIEVREMSKIREMGELKDGEIENWQKWERQDGWGLYRNGMGWGWGRVTVEKGRQIGL